MNISCWLQWTNIWVEKYQLMFLCFLLHHIWSVLRITEIIFCAVCVCTHAFVFQMKNLSFTGYTKCFLIMKFTRHVCFVVVVSFSSVFVYCWSSWCWCFVHDRYIWFIRPLCINYNVIYTDRGILLQDSECLDSVTLQSLQFGEEVCFLFAISCLI